MIAQKSGEEIRVLDEIVLSRATTLQACEEFYLRFPNHQAPWWCMATRRGTKMQTPGKSDYAIIGISNCVMGT